MSRRVLIVDDHRMFREGLRALLVDAPGVEVVGEASDGLEAVALVEQLKPDVVLMDIVMAGLNGIDATQRIRQKSPECLIVAISMHSDRRYVANMLRAGANGFLLKDCAFTELLQALETVCAGRAYISPQIAKTVLDDYLASRQRSDGKEVPQLTQHERAVLQLFAEGKTTKEVAGRLDVSVKTIETHRKHIMDKLEIYSIAELTKYAVRDGLTSI
jgi:DNA-binding NarL/FixJ family response regulator